MKDSLYNISINTNAGSDFYLLLGDFLDEFYRSVPEIRAQMILMSPTDMQRREYVPILAGTAHKLANDCGIEPPPWAFDERCYMPGGEPHFACNARGKLRLLFMYKSPSEFKHRNLFVDENVLIRV